jgi:hypothetical protein
MRFFVLRANAPRSSIKPPSETSTTIHNGKPGHNQARSTPLRLKKYPKFTPNPSGLIVKANAAMVGTQDQIQMF